MPFRILLFVLLLLASETIPSLAQQADADAVVGTWLTEPKNAKVKIFRRGGAYFGKVVWLKEPNNEKGEPKLDKENPEEKLRNRPIMGLELLRDFVYDEDLVWEDGEIYDPKNGKTYSCKMTLSADRRTLDVRGYIGISLIGRTQVWTRTDD
jgi:uncharacterized protein (DUF2147 family)